MAIWWISEAIPIAATAMLPLALFPLLGIQPISAAVAPYANPIIFLFMGGFMMAAAFERWGLHRRIALRVVHAVGTRPANIVAGCMGASALLSMHPGAGGVRDLRQGRPGKVPHPPRTPLRTPSGSSG